jgi:phosphoribosyl-ATP pyrophosphohydrolase
MNSSILDSLFNQVKNNIKGDPKKSYTAFLASCGSEKIAKKVTEEAFEVAIASLDGSGHKSGKEQVILETADLFYHVLVLLASKNVELKDVMVELDRRNKIKDLGQRSIDKINKS